MLRSGSQILKRGFRVQYNCDLLPPEPIAKPEIVENAFLYLNGESREGATGGVVRKLHEIYNKEIQALIWSHNYVKINSSLAKLCTSTFGIQN